MANKINSSVFEDILGEGTNTDEAITTPTAKRPVGRPKSLKTASRTTFVLDDELLIKVRAISKLTGFPMKNIIEKVLRDLIAKYEAKKGTIDTSVIESTRSIEDIF